MYAIFFQLSLTPTPTWHYFSSFSFRCMRLTLFFASLSRFFIDRYEIFLIEEPILPGSYDPELSPEMHRLTEKLESRNIHKHTN